MAGIPSNVNVQAAIAANSVRESYDSISNLIDANSKKLDADVFTAHDNFADNDLTAVLNSEKFATDIHGKLVGPSLFQPQSITVNPTSLENHDLPQAQPELSGANHAESFFHGGNNEASQGREHSAAPQPNSLHESAHDLTNNHLAENTYDSSTYNKGGSSDHGKDGTDGKDGTSCTCGDGPCHCGCGDKGEQHHHKGHGRGHDWTPVPDPHHHHDHDNGHNHDHQHHNHNHDHDHNHQHQPHCDDHNPHQPHQPHLPELHLPHLPNLLNVDLLGNLGGNLLHGHLGNPNNPLINIIGGGNLLQGANNSGGYGRLLDVLTNVNV